MSEEKTDLKKLPLHDLHVELGGRMVPFAGYEMPVQYPLGVMKEHLHVREKAGLFDVSHMGQCFLKTREVEHGSAEAHKKVAAAIETLVPGEIAKLKEGRIRYSLLLNDMGGIEDDLMITHMPGDNYQGWLYLVVNAAVKEQDFALLKEKLGDRAELDVKTDLALLALQGPKAADILVSLGVDVAEMPFMSANVAQMDDIWFFISRCGYTGEDGFEISVHDHQAEAVARKLLAHQDVEAIGLGARDSLRLEAGLCLYGHDMTAKETPVEANLTFALGKRRRAEGGFPGADRILSQLSAKPEKMRVGIKPSGRAPAREGTEIQNMDGVRIGEITSGGFGPTFEAPVAMGYVDIDHADVGAAVQLMIRGKAVPAEVAEMPFVPQRYYRGK
ncbi:glycine cleavage system aminomethyltransferase GcvT [Parvularcula sp. IMCC14364]|uniref:glycine cleavage system aminomethyltransferase GcvT n=1 Tax=Parvularcula sp. IMCC14364 TaxID=3067902 RepID=UPI002740356C|nr:glycine cleavage system aminomethyltransferase GcvT [Parvularcula sp. IMCC14364]